MKKAEQVISINTVRDYNERVGADTLHPLISVVNFNEMPTFVYFKQYMHVYAVFLKNIKCGNIIYGCKPYDYEDGTLVFVSPGQVYGIDSKGKTIKPSGYALVFHPDLIHGTHLGRHIRDYTFFSYEVNEALHLSKKERQTIVTCLEQIAGEITQSIDKHSKTLLVSNIELFLNYCMRFYDRQFITRSHANKTLLARLENLLHQYITSGKAIHEGLPAVAWCAEQLNLSANYFGDLIKKETGQTALDHIQNKLVNEAKLRMTDPAKSLQMVSAELGFKYPQHFTRLFKQKTGISPKAFRGSLQAD